MSKEKTYLVVHLRDIDSDIVIRRMTAKQIRKLPETMHINDFAVIEGEVLKAFASKNLNRIKVAND